MITHYTYTCPNCSQECSVESTLTGQNVQCPHCAQEFFATPPDTSTQVVVPEKLPFFKAARKRILEQRLEQLTADGELSSQDDEVLTKTAILLGLKDSDLQEVARKRFLAEFAAIQQRMEKTFVLTDQDLHDIDALKKKYGVKNLRLEGTAQLFRQIYLLEEQGQLPPPIDSGLMLDPEEHVYFQVASTWHQSRMQTHGYSGTSVSLPITRGVRFRFGQFSPMRTEEITPLSSGTLCATSKRLMFHGDRRNTSITYGRIIDAHIHSDCLKVEKSTGKPDYFTMNAAEGRYVASLIGAFKSGTPSAERERVE